MTAPCRLGTAPRKRFGREPHAEFGGFPIWPDLACLFTATTSSALQHVAYDDREPQLVSEHDSDICIAGRKDR
jgi:hypothetical protein